MIDRVDSDFPVLPRWLSRSNRTASPGKNIPFADGSGSGRKMANMRLPNCWNDGVILIQCPSAIFRYHPIVSRIIDLGLSGSHIFLLTSLEPPSFAVLRPAGILLRLSLARPYYRLPHKQRSPPKVVIPASFWSASQQRIQDRFSAKSRATCKPCSWSARTRMAIYCPIVSTQWLLVSDDDHHKLNLGALWTVDLHCQSHVLPVG